MKTLKEILAATEKNNAAYTATIAAFNKEQFNKRPAPEVWSAAENTQHLIISVSAGLPAYYLPLFIMKMVFGKANRPSKTYEGLVEKYKAKLSLGIKAAGKFVPEQKIYEPATLIRKWIQVDKRYRKLLTKASEERLENCIVPHPLISKITVRELCFFHIYHTEHHHEIVKRIQL